MNWGIIGYGEIAPAFINALTTSIEEQTLYAIASVSNYEKAKRDFKNVLIYTSYSELLNDSLVEIVYICTTNQLHYDNVNLALMAGKHVLCEKPVAMNSAALTQLLKLAKVQQKFFMEGMWTRFLPGYRHFMSLLEHDEIGRVSFLRADFGFFSNWGEERRLKNKQLFGGTILDNADYNLFLSQDIFQSYPVKISAFGKFGHTDVVETCGIMLQYPDGAISQVFSSFQQQTKQEAHIYGTKGFIYLESYWHGTKVVLNTTAGEKIWEFPFLNNGFEYEIEEVIRCIAAGMRESPKITHEMSLEMAKIIDDVNKQLDSHRETITLNHS